MTSSTLAAVPGDRARRLSWLLWSAYLASSWTWCIGMFLPALLERDFGAAALAAFALPNVIGAAAMGWVLADDDRGRDLFARHLWAVRAFSLVTVAFHAAFLAMIVAPLARVAGAGAMVPVLFAGPVVLAALGAERPWALAAYATSAACMGLWMGTSARGSIPDLDIMARSIELTRLPFGHILPLAAVCVTGFTLCPYLDATFHRARQRQSAGGARLSFTFGFGVLFAAMLVFSAAYAPIFWDTYRHGAALPPRATILIVLTHLAVQTGITTALHLRALGRVNADAPARPNAWNVAAAAGLLTLAAAELATSVGPAFPRGMAPPVSERHEWYRLFMAFYGLVFPAYVYLVMIPTWRGGRATRRHWGVLALAVACAAPSLFLGFIAGRTWWLAAGVAAVLLCRGLIPPTDASAPPAR